jgi:hypothetical protein
MNKHIVLVLFAKVSSFGSGILSETVKAFFFFDFDFSSFSWCGMALRVGGWFL